MDFSAILVLTQETLFIISVFCIFLLIGLVKGRFTLINIILALYIAFAVSLRFPFYDFFVQNQSKTTAAMATIAIFVCFTVVGVLLLRRHIPGNDYEKTFENFRKKVILALLATILVVVFSYHELPMIELISQSSPIQSLFVSDEYFFWWLIIPIVVLFFV